MTLSAGALSAWMSCQSDHVIEASDGTPFAEAGDSGAIIVKDGGEVVGLLFAANSASA